MTSQPSHEVAEVLQQVIRRNRRLIDRRCLRHIDKAPQLKRDRLKKRNSRPPQAAMADASRPIIRPLLRSGVYAFFFQQATRPETHGGGTIREKLQPRLLNKRVYGRLQ